MSSHEVQRQFATLRSRLRAFAFDLLVVWGLLMAVTVAGFVVSRFVDVAEVDPWLADATVFVTLIVPVILYFAISESSESGATWGKRQVGLRVVDLEGRRIRGGRALGRSTLKFLPWQLAHTGIFQANAGENASRLSGLIAPVLLILAYVLIGLNVVWLIRSSRNQTFYDQLVGTVVFYDTEREQGD